MTSSSVNFCHHERANRSGTTLFPARPHDLQKCPKLRTGHRGASEGDRGCGGKLAKCDLRNKVRITGTRAVVGQIKQVNIFSTCRSSRTIPKPSAPSKCQTKELEKPSQANRLASQVSVGCANVWMVSALAASGSTPCAASLAKRTKIRQDISRIRTQLRRTSVPQQ